MRKKPYRLVIIEWVDSIGCGSRWEFLPDKKAEALLCRSVGWLIQDNKQCKVVVPHMSAPGQPDITPQGLGDMVIPTVAILSITDLRPPKAVKRKKG